MLPVKLTASVGVPLHFVWSAGSFTVGVGLTVTVKETGVPGQLLIVGVTSIVPLIGAFVVLVIVNGAILPVPMATNPIAGFVFVQLQVTPVMLPIKFTASVNVPLHPVWLPGLSTVGVGLTIMVKEVEAPVQPTDGVTVIVALIGAVVELVAVNEAILPVPMAGKPIAALSFVQL